MSVRLDEIMNLASFEDAQVVAGSDGLNRSVRWIHTAEMLRDIREFVQWTEGEELLLLSGVGIDSEEKFVEFVHLCNINNISGLIIFIGPYLSEVPKRVIDLAESLDFPIITVPWKISAVKVSNDIGELIIKKRQEQTTLSSILENILFNEITEPEMLINQSSFYGHNLRKAYRVMDVNINDFSGYIKKKKLTDEHKIQEVKELYKKTIESCLSFYYSKFFYTMVSDSAICLLPSKGMEKEKLREVGDDIRSEIKRVFKDITASVCFGNSYSQIANFKKSMQEADKTLLAHRRMEKEDFTAFYDELGVNMLLVELEESKVLKDFYRNMMGDILRYDKVNNGDLVETIKVYLKENGNIVRAADHLFIHRNTMKYRLDKIFEISGFDLQDPEVKFNMQLAFYIQDFM